MSKHPMQKLVRDDEGTVRFRVNEVAVYLMEYLEAMAVNRVLRERVLHPALCSKEDGRQGFGETE